MLHAKFQNHRPSGSGERFFKVFAIYSHGGHLSYVTWTIYTNFPSAFLSLALIGQAVSEEKFEYYGHIHVYSPGAGAGNPLGTKFSHKHKYSVHLPISCKFCPSNHILTIFPIQMHGRPMLTLP